MTSVTVDDSVLDPAQLLDRLAEGDAVFVSSIMAERYGLGQGDTICLKTRRGERDFDVVGTVVDFASQGPSIQGSFRDARRYFGVNDVSFYLAKVEPGHDVMDVLDRVDQRHGTRRHLTIVSNESFKGEAWYY